MEHASSLPIELEAPPATPAFSQTTAAEKDQKHDSHREEGTEEDPPVRRNSVNVASVYRSNRSLLHLNSCLSSSLISDNENDVTTKGEDGTNNNNGSGFQRRNSINVASFMRSSKVEVEENPGILASLSPWSKLQKRARQSLNVDIDTIRQHIQFQQYNHEHHQNQHFHKEIDDPTTTITSESPPPPIHINYTEVQFTIPEDDCDQEDNSDVENANYIHRRIHRPVTFGAYYDTHNDEIIPELRQVESEAIDDDVQEKKDAFRRLQKIVNDAPPILQIFATNIACIFTYAIMRTHSDLHLQILTMVLVTLCGSTLPHLITAVACGVYAGSVSADTLPSYFWVLLLGFVTSIVWQIVSTWRYMLGFSGRLGASAFAGMNITAIVTFSLSPSVGFDRYGSLDRLWDDTMALEEAFITLLSCIFLASTASYFRLNATVPVNPVLVPSAWALFCMLLVSLIDYQYNPSIYGGFAVGSYVAMAAESRLPSVKCFATVGLIAGLWIIFFNPFFLGFGGKSGFTAMIGYSTFLMIQKVYRKCCSSKRRQPSPKPNQEEDSNLATDPRGDEEEGSAAVKQISS